MDDDTDAGIDVHEPSSEPDQTPDLAGHETADPQQQPTFRDSLCFDNDAFMVPPGFPAVDCPILELPPQLLQGSFFTDLDMYTNPRPRSVSDSQPQDVARRLALRDLSSNPPPLMPVQWNGPNTTTVTPGSNFPLAPTHGPNEPYSGWLVQNPRFPQIAFPVPVIPQPHMSREFVVETGESKRIMIECGRGRVHVCAKFRLDYEYGLIDAGLAKEMKLPFIPLLPNKKQPRESPQGVIRPTKFVQLTVTGMEAIPGGRPRWPTQLRLCVFRSTHPFGKIILGRAAARALGLQSAQVDVVGDRTGPERGTGVGGSGYVQGAPLDGLSPTEGGQASLPYVMPGTHMG